MIKSGLILRIAQKVQILEKDAALCVNLIFKKISDHLAAGGRIEIRDFGSFDLHYRKARKAHNPKTGEKLVTESKYAVHFKPGKGLKDRVNASSHLPIKEAHEDDNVADTDSGEIE